MLCVPTFKHIFNKLFKKKRVTNRMCMKKTYGMNIKVSSLINVSDSLPNAFIQSLPYAHSFDESLMWIYIDALHLTFVRIKDKK